MMTEAERLAAYDRMYADLLKDIISDASRKLADIGANVPAAATLTNTGGLPAFPFRTDDWDDVK